MRELLLPVIAILAVMSSVSSEQNKIPTSCPGSDLENETAVQLAYENDCTKFYKCSYGKKYLMDCPEYREGHKLYFDPLLQVCNWPWITQCSPRRPDCSSGDRALESHAYDCKLYHACENGVQVVKECDEGQQFDSKLLKCLPIEIAKCNIYLDKCPTEPLLQPVLLPHDCKCHMYYECVNGEFVEKYCPPDMKFHIGRRECVLDKNSDCTDAVGDSVCPTTGTVYIADKTDCGSYYICVDGVKTKETCYNGLSFDQETSMCTWPPSNECSSKSTRALALTASLPNVVEQAIVRKCPAKGSKDVVNFTHECLCNLYYTCDDGSLIRKECPQGLIFDYIRGVCDYPESAACENSSNCNLTLEPAVRSKMTQVLSENVYQTQCSPYGNERLPHETDCAKYYQCSNGKKHLQRCLRGHYFNEVLEACDLDVNTQCNNPTPVVTTDPPVCPVNNCDYDCIIRFPDEKNCSLYYQCDEGTKVSKSCPDGLYYDPKEQLCTFIKDKNCEKVPNETCIEGTRTSHECQCNKYYVCNSKGQQVLQTCDPGTSFDFQEKVCKDERIAQCHPPKHTDCIGFCSSNSSTETLPHKDCHKYCKCSNGSPNSLKCDDNKVYDQMKQKCDFPENVQNLQCDPFPCGSDESGTLLPHECFCDRYYWCNKGSKILYFCEHGKYFDYETKICTDFGAAHCYSEVDVPGTEKCEETCSKGSWNVSLSHEDCTHYCKCSNGRRIVEECPKGLYYHPEKRMCEWAENIRNLTCDPFPCKNNIIVNYPHECNCDLYYECNDGLKHRINCTDGLNFDYLRQMCVNSSAHCYRKPENINILEIEDCIGTCPKSSPSTVYLPHKDCSKYCVCDNQPLYVMQCAGNYHYSKSKQVCTLPEIANCETLAYT